MVSIIGSARAAEERHQVNPTVDNYTAVLPWYERADFQRLWELAHDRDQMPCDYEIWHANALEVMNTWLARGRAVQIVTIRSEEFLPWLAERQLPNTAATRLKFVEDKARGCAAIFGAVAAERSSAPM